MSHRITFTLEDEAFNFLTTVAGRNKSPFINELILKEKQHTLEESILLANREEAMDDDYLESINEWDSTLSDGL